MARNSSPLVTHPGPRGRVEEDMMRKQLAAVVFSAAILALPAAAGAAPGQDIKAACGSSFGQLISAAKSSGMMGALSNGCLSRS